MSAIFNDLQVETADHRFQANGDVAKEVHRDNGRDSFPHDLPRQVDRIHQEGDRVHVNQNDAASVKSGARGTADVGYGWNADHIAGLEDTASGKIKGGRATIERDIILLVRKSGEFRLKLSDYGSQCGPSAGECPDDRLDFLLPIMGPEGGNQRLCRSPEGSRAIPPGKLSELNLMKDHLTQLYGNFRNGATIFRETRLYLNLLNRRLRQRCAVS